MQTRPANWGTLLAAPHTTDYRFVIGGTEYGAEDIRGVPFIEKPLMQEPTIGRCCTGSLTLTVKQKSGVPIAKASPVVAYCRLISRDGATTTDWVELGHYWVSRRSGLADLVTLTCRDAMIFAGQTYADKTQFEEWPVAMVDVVDEIASIVGITLDVRTTIQTGADYVVAYPNEDVLISEILGMVAAAHGGLFIMSEVGQLRLVPYPDTGNPVFAIGGAYGKYTPFAGTKRVSRITLTDSANNQFTSGDDTGIELVAECESATQELVNGLLGGFYLSHGVLHTQDGATANGVCLFWDDGVLEKGVFTPGKVGLFGRVFTPYALTSTYLDPCVELGDTISIDRKGSALSLVVESIKIRCSPSFVCDLQNGVEDDDEDEYPYISTADLQAKRYVSTMKSYYGNRLDRRNGFTSELLQDGAPVARLTANASAFSMQRYRDGAWENCIYFDAQAQKYKLTGAVDVEGMITSTDLSTSGQTTINGNNITTGTLNAQLVQILGTTKFYWNSDNIYIIDPADANNQIRIGRFDGTNYGIGYTSNGGSTWQNAIGFDGITLQAGSVTQQMLDPDIDLGGSTIFYTGATPTGAKSGDVWYDTGASHAIKRYNGGTWIDITNDALYSALTAAGTAQATADGKIKTFAQTAAPTSSMAAGDLWFDTDDNNRQYRYNRQRMGRVYIG